MIQNYLIMLIGSCGVNVYLMLNIYLKCIIIIHVYIHIISKTVYGSILYIERAYYGFRNNCLYILYYSNLSTELIIFISD